MRSLSRQTSGNAATRASLLSAMRNALLGYHDCAPPPVLCPLSSGPASGTERVQRSHNCAAIALRKMGFVRQVPVFALAREMPPHLTLRMRKSRRQMRLASGRGVKGEVSWAR